MISDEQLDKFERVAKAATGSPWFICDSDRNRESWGVDDNIVFDGEESIYGWQILVGDPDGYSIVHGEGSHSTLEIRQDLDFIAAARNLALPLIETIRELQGIAKIADEMIEALNKANGEYGDTIERLQAENAALKANQPTATNREITSLVECFRGRATMSPNAEAYRWAADQLEAAINQVERWREAEELEGAKVADFDWLKATLPTRAPDFGPYLSISNEWWCVMITGTTFWFTSDTKDKPTRSQVLHLLAALGMEKKQ